MSVATGETPLNPPRDSKGGGTDTERGPSASMTSYPRAVQLRSPDVDTRRSRLRNGHEKQQVGPSPVTT